MAPLLSTKLYISRRQKLTQQTTLVQRPRLLEKLDAGIAGKLMLVAAPTGFGKSTLLGEWIDKVEASQQAEHNSSNDAATSILNRSAPVELVSTPKRPIFCWLSLEDGDNDPIRFWVYVIAALHSLNPGLSPDTPALLQSPAPPPLETVITILLNDLSAWSTKIVLILEDYHVITTLAIHQSLTFLLDHLPSTLHLVITTRSDPPLSLAHLRARGQLSEIRAADLRFTAAETASFLNERMGLELSPDEVRLLATRTEGWIAGIQLAALAMRGQEDKTDFLRAFSGNHRYILNYLTEEVLNQQPKKVQEFLLHTSILTRLCGSLCDAVMDVGENNGEAIVSLPPHLDSRLTLEQLAQANLFLVSLDDLGQWYRYHQLFAEVLQHRLRHSQPEILPTLHRRASLWYEQESPADAIPHSLQAADFSHAATLIERVWSTLWDKGAFTTLFNWMQALPTVTVQDIPLESSALASNALWGSPSLYVSYAWGLALTGQIESAESCLGQIETTLQNLVSETDVATTTYNILSGRTAALRALLAARRGEPTDAVALAQKALSLISADTTQRGDAYYALGLAKQQLGALPEAFQAYEAATELGMAASNTFLASAARYHEARILMAQGHLNKAATAYQEILMLTTSTKKRLSIEGLAHIGYGEILYQRNDLSAAAHQVDIGLTLSPYRDLAYTDGPLHRFSILARVRQAMSDREGALAAIDLAKGTAQQTGIALDIARAAALESLIHLRLGEPSAANRWAEQYAAKQIDGQCFTYLHEFESLVFVRVLIAQNATDTALTFLSHWRPLVEATQRHGSMIELYALQGLAFYLSEQTDTAMHTLGRALTLAEPEGYIRLFADEGESMRSAIGDFRIWIRKQPQTDAQANLLCYSSKLLNAFANSQSLLGESTEVLTVNNQNLIDPLTEREFEVLHLIASGLSNAAIAKQLMISVGTIKTHLKHIYAKLAVQSRTQAVAQARILGLL